MASLVDAGHAPSGQRRRERRETCRWLLLLALATTGVLLVMTTANAVRIGEVSSQEWGYAVVGLLLEAFALVLAMRN